MQEKATRQVDQSIGTNTHPRDRLRKAKCGILMLHTRNSSDPEFLFPVASLCQRGREAGTGKGFAQNSSVRTSGTVSSDRSTILPVSNNKN